MYLLASTSAVVECPRARVFDYATDLTHFAQWFPGVVEVKSRDQFAHSTVGKEYEESVFLPGRGRQSITLRVAEADPPRKFVTEGALPLLLPRMEIEFEDAGLNACRLHWRMFSRNTSLAARWTVLPLVRLGMQKRADAAMRRLKKLLASDAASVPRTGFDPDRCSGPSPSRSGCIDVQKGDVPCRDPERGS